MFIFPSIEGPCWLGSDLVEVDVTMPSLLSFLPGILRFLRQTASLSFSRFVIVHHFMYLLSAVLRFWFLPLLTIRFVFSCR